MSAKLRIGALLALVLTALLLLPLGCQPSPSVSPSPTVTLTRYQNAYRLFDRYADYFW